MFRKIVIFVVICLFVSGCDLLFPKKEEESEVKRKSSVRGSLLAKVNDWAIGTVDFRKRLDALKALDPKINVEDIEFKRQFLQELVNIEILAQEAEERGLDKEKEVVDAVENFKRTLLAQRMLENLAREITITDVEIENFYESNKLSLREPEKRKVREIVVPSEAQAKDILIRLLQGEDFSLLARNYSIAESRNKDGDLGFLEIDEKTIAEERFPNFWQRVLTTEEGKISNYFKHPEKSEYYIIKVESIKGGELMPLGKVRDRIRTYLRREKMDKRKEDLIYNAKQKFKVTINEDLLDFREY